MAPIWHKYYEECRSVVFVVDAAAPDTLTGAASQLHTLLQHDSLKVWLVFSLSCLLDLLLLSFSLWQACVSFHCAAPKRIVQAVHLAVHSLID